MEGDLTRTIESEFDRIGHIQLADNPGRHEPGTREINYPFLFRRIDATSATASWIGCEYKPATTTTAGLGWFGLPIGPKERSRQASPIPLFLKRWEQIRPEQYRIYRLGIDGPPHGRPSHGRRAQALGSRSMRRRRRRWWRRAPSLARTLAETSRAAQMSSSPWFPTPRTWKRPLFGPERRRRGPFARQDRRRHEQHLADREQGVRQADQRARLRLPRRAGSRRRRRG